MLDRLNAASKTGTTQGWTYDANGNRLTQTGIDAEHVHELRHQQPRELDLRVAAAHAMRTTTPATRSPMPAPRSRTTTAAA